MSDAAAPPHSFSIGRVLMLLVPLALIVWGANKIYSNNVQQEQQAADARGQRTTLTGLFGSTAEAASLDKAYSDANGDLVADAPTDADKLIDPDELKFADVAASDPEGQEEVWKAFLDALAKNTGKKVTLVTYSDTAEQMRALKSGDLHVTAFSTGEVQGAVNEDGFVPAACFADKDGNYRITMKIIVPADSPIKTLEDIKGRRVTFVRPRSNSGCTAALVMLFDKYNLQPERDYKWGFSYGHENSIHGIAKHQFEVAAVASDILKREVADGNVAEDSYREIYESESFPPGVVGFAYNLTPELQSKIRETLVDFDWAGSGLEKKYQKVGWAKFAPMNYKDDWAAVRKIRETGGAMLAQLDD